MLTSLIACANIEVEGDYKINIIKTKGEVLWTAMTSVGLSG